MAHPTALWRVLWRFFVFCLLVGRILADARETFAAEAAKYQEKMEAPAFRVEDYHKAYQAFISNNDFIGPFFDGGHE